MKEFYCRECDRYFSTSQALSVHLSNSAVHRKDSPQDLAAARRKAKEEEKEPAKRVAAEEEGVNEDSDDSKDETVILGSSLRSGKDRVERARKATMATINAAAGRPGHMLRAKLERKQMAQVEKEGLGNKTAKKQRIVVQRFIREHTEGSDRVEAISAETHELVELDDDHLKQERRAEPETQAAEDPNKNMWGYKGSLYAHPTANDTKTDATVKVYRSWFNSFATRFVGVGRKAFTDDLEHIQNQDPTFPKNLRHDGRVSRRAARQNKFCPKSGGGVEEETGSESSSSGSNSDSDSSSGSEEESTDNTSGEVAKASSRKAEDKESSRSRSPSVEEGNEKDALWCAACKRGFASSQALASHKNNSAEHRRNVAALAKAVAAAKKAAKAEASAASKPPDPPANLAAISEFDYPGDDEEETKAEAAFKKDHTSSFSGSGGESNGAYDASACFKVGTIVEVHKKGDWYEGRVCKIREKNGRKSVRVRYLGSSGDQDSEKSSEKREEWMSLHFNQVRPSEKAKGQEDSDTKSPQPSQAVQESAGMKRKRDEGPVGKTKEGYDAYLAKFARFETSSSAPEAAEIGLGAGAAANSAAHAHPSTIPGLENAGGNIPQMLPPLFNGEKANCPPSMQERVALVDKLLPSPFANFNASNPFQNQNSLPVLPGLKSADLGLPTLQLGFAQVLGGAGPFAANNGSTNSHQADGSVGNFWGFNNRQQPTARDVLSGVGISCAAAAGSRSGEGDTKGKESSDSVRGSMQLKELLL